MPVIELPIRDGNMYDGTSANRYVFVIELPIRDGNLDISHVARRISRLLNFL